MIFLNILNCVYKEDCKKFYNNKLSRLKSNFELIKVKVHFFKSKRMKHSGI